jgi:protein TonB
VRIAPVYPPELKRNRVQGTVNVVFIVDELGNVKRPSIEKSSNREFNENALKAVRQWKFEPGEKDNKKVKTRVRLPLAFTLRR